MIPTWRLIWWNIAFETALAVPCTALGLVGFAMKPNYERVMDTMSMHPHPLKRIGYRIIGCIRLFF